ncbi:MAG: hypothetical protein Q7J76_08260 [Candidatus Brocadiaceae bacterium]|nr:hypothetical protein [Candidatus Brocadiaceae bacterium]
MVQAGSSGVEGYILPAARWQFAGRTTTAAPCRTSETGLYVVEDFGQGKGCYLVYRPPFGEEELSDYQIPPLA